MIFLYINLVNKLRMIISNDIAINKNFVFNNGNVSNLYESKSYNNENANKWEFYDLKEHFARIVKLCKID